MAKEPLVNNFEVPSWAGKPPSGLHLDVLKEGKMIQKLMIDEKKCYFFGRNKQLCDFCIDHASCSRVHAALVWHKHLARPFIMDLGSTHGTFIGHIRLESKKPQQVPIDSEIHFGASTRIYMIRERPQPVSNLGGSEEMEKRNDDIEGGLLGLPESETELDNLTEFNTAHNRRIASLVDIPDHSVPSPLKRKRKNTHVIFRDEDEIINPEDIDPTVGKFRNLVQTSIIPSKRSKVEASTGSSNMGVEPSKRSTNFPFNTPSLYGDLPPGGTTEGQAGGIGSYSIAAKLGLPIPNLAPNLEEEETVVPVVKPNPVVLNAEESTKEPKKKKYAKEAWPGKKPLPTLLV